MRENIKQEILETARALFNQKGYRETTMREIACALQISLGNLTYHYHKKEDLMIALLEGPEFMNHEPAENFKEFFELIQAMVDSLIVNRFFYTVDELGLATSDFYRHNVDMIAAIERRLEESMQQLSDYGFFVPWRSMNERHAFARMIMDSHIVWIKNSFYRKLEDQIPYKEFIALHWYLLESRVSPEKQTDYAQCFHQFCR